MVYGVCMLYRIWCIEPVEPPWLARGGSIAPVEPPLATGMNNNYSVVLCYGFVIVVYFQ